MKQTAFVALAASTLVYAVAAAAAPGKTFQDPVLGPVHDAPLVQSGYYASGGEDALAMQQRQFELQRSLERIAPSVDLGAGFTISIDAGARSEIGQASDGADLFEADERRLKVGVTRPLGARIGFGAQDLGLADGRAIAHRGGGLIEARGMAVWAAPIASSGAHAVRARFENVSLAPGAELYVYNAAGQAFGPFTGAGPHGDGEFWSPTLAGERMTVQLQGPTAAIEASGFDIAEIAHLGPRFTIANDLVPFAIPMPEDPSGGDPRGAAACVVDANCTNSDSAITPAEDGVAYIEFVEGAFVYICSGGLIANSGGRNLFLTANHCVGKGRTARTVEAFFNYRTTGCNNWNSFGTPGSVSGANLLASGRSSDYSLLELNSNPPSGTYFIGYDATPIANSSGVVLHRLSHPHGSAQAYSRHTVRTNGPLCGTLPRGAFIYSQDQEGATLGGSSGSPVIRVVNNEPKIVGQLYGACGSNLNDECDTQNNSTVDGALAAYFSSVEQYLGGGGEPPPPDDGSGGNEKGRKKCTDGIDNDGDGLVDGADPDCN